ncbi:MAG: glycosyltransferase, partial [bacterium]
MKILWLVNIALPEANLLMKRDLNPLGGWLTGMANSIKEIENIELIIAYPENKIKDVIELNGDKVKFFAFPHINAKEIKTNKDNKNLLNIIGKIKPDLVHIFGTEYLHSLAMVKLCKSKNIKSILLIQGLTSIISKHYSASLPSKVLNRYTFRDFLKNNNILKEQERFKTIGLYEIEALKIVNFVMGRTTWDYACVKQINPDITYYHCNETLRDEFYKHTWDISKCEQYSIFVSRAVTPLKGLHFLLEALPIILKQFPKTKLYIGGGDITKSNAFFDRLKLSSYAKYIKELIIKLKLQDKIIFTGLLDEQQMCERFLKSHVYVNPSTIENESNSISEAKLLGVPCVASYVGGVIDRIEHGIDGYLYQHDAPYMLAYY